MPDKLEPAYVCVAEVLAGRVPDDLLRPLAEAVVGALVTDRTASRALTMTAVELGVWDRGV